MAEPILTVEHLIKAYGETPVLDDISFAVKPGEVIVVVGPSGCGKSTLLRCLNGLEPTQSGRVRLGSETVAYGGKNLTQLRQRIGMVFQSYELFPHMTVLDNVLLAPTKVQKRPKAEVQQEAEALLDRVGLLANGTEDEKGSNFTKACFPAMKAAVPGFVGNCEGTDLTSGNFDVVVADGMSGNIALKATEGAAKFLLQELKGAVMASLGTKIAALLIKKQMREIKAKLSGDAKGGAILLGLRGVVLIGHGATSVEAVKNGTLAAAEAVRAGLVENVANSMDGIVL